MTKTLKKHVVAFVILLSIDLVLAIFLFFSFNNADRRIIIFFILFSFMLFCIFDLLFMIKAKYTNSNNVGGRILFLIFSAVGIIFLAIKAFSEIVFLIPVILLLPVLIVSTLWEYFL